jgi:aminoglycoside phosphotransferase
MNMVLTFLTRNWQRLSLERFGAPSRLSCVIATPRFRSSSHIIFFILADGLTDPILIVKVPRLPGDNDRLDREAVNLRMVHAARTGGFDSIPRLVAYEDYASNRLLIETALAGQTMSLKLRRHQPEPCVEAVLPWLIELHRATATRGANATGWYERLAEYPLQQFIKTMPLSTEELHMIEQTQALTSLLRDRDIPLVFEHSDLGPPNILLPKEGGLGVVDWELAEPRGFPAVDLFFFLTLVTSAWRRARSHAEYVAAFHETFFGPSAWARPYIVRYAKSMQLSPEILMPLFVLCWCRYVAGLVMRLHDFDVSKRLLENEAAGWLRSNRYYALWRHTIKHVEELNLVS